MSEEEDIATHAGDLVVVGSSAGGIDALSILVSTLPNDFPAPIVLAQHLDPNRPSNLDKILQLRTALPVEVVTASSQLHAGTIYVVPSNRNIAIHDHYVEPQKDIIKRPKPSVDMLLTSAAKIYGEHLIAVILTGYGSDGAAGAVEVKKSGGTVIVQDPQTARFPSMPLALPPTVIDFKTTIEQIGPLLYDLLTGVSHPQPEEKIGDQLRHILELVSRQTSIDFRHYKMSTIQRRVSRRMAVTDNRTMHDYILYLETHPEETRELVNAFLINVTQFFRDLDAFNFLKSDVLPTLIEKARQRDRVLRFWAAGCATGEEAYSLAMLLADLLDSDLPEWSIKIFATDLDEAAINFARQGLYSEGQLKNVPSEYLQRFFENTEQGYRITKRLRQIVIFGQQDLGKHAPFPHIDLVVCRNVLIYFTPELQDFVLNRFAFSLYPNGYLFLGKAETVRPSQVYYELINKHWKMYQCKENALPKAHLSGLTNIGNIHTRTHTPDHNLQARGKPISPNEQRAPILELGQLRHFNELILRFLPVGMVIIDSSYHILTANTTARRLLGFHHIDSEQDFLHSIRNIPYANMRDAIDTVFRERRTVTIPEIELNHSLGENSRILSLSLSPMQVETITPFMVIISIMDVTEQVQVRQQLETTQIQKDQLVGELSSANKLLNTMNKELIEANEGLQVTNEELILTHEELQATAEEFETTNEELQAANEELETSNEELQATNEELETTNDELRVSTIELQELTKLLENEKAQLGEMIQLAPFDIMVLRGPNLIVEAFNLRHTRQSEGHIAKGQPLRDFVKLFWETNIDIVHLAQEAYQHDAARATPRILISLPNASGESEERYLVYTLVPSHDVNGKVSGLVIYTEDVTEQRAKEIADEYEKLKLIFDHADIAALALYDAHTSKLIMGSPHYLDSVACMNGLEPSELIGHTWQDLTKVMLGEQTTTLWNTVLETCAPLHLPEVHFQLQEQETIWDWNFTPILDREKQDAVRFILVSAIEITQQALARQEMEQLSNLKDEFLSVASHELRTPLTTILGNAEMLRRRLHRQATETNHDAAEQKIRILEGIVHQVNRMTKLIDEMLDATRISREQFMLNKTENVDIIELVRRTIEQQAVTTNRSLIFNPPQKTLLGTWDEARLEQVLSNLISNAIKYSLPDQPITIGIELRPDSTQPSEVVVLIQDQGPGISEEEQAHIFDRYHRGRAHNHPALHGLGLGLYIAREIVTLHGGHIWLDSKPGKGSTFSFSLPLRS